MRRKSVFSPLWRASRTRAFTIARMPMAGPANGIDQPACRTRILRPTATSPHKAKQAAILHQSRRRRSRLATRSRRALSAVGGSRRKFALLMLLRIWKSASERGGGGGGGNGEALALVRVSSEGRGRGGAAPRAAPPRAPMCQAISTLGGIEQ